jgi:glycerophosphoryl diester phosphodiesterase
VRDARSRRRRHPDKQSISRETALYFCGARFGYVPPHGREKIRSPTHKEAPLRGIGTTSTAHFERTLPLVIGHRGAAGCAPENTLAGLRKARELKCRWVEFDVRLTADGQLILLHDERLDRTTNGRGEVARLPLAEIRCYDAGSRFAAFFRGERVPTLAEAVMVLGEIGIGANIELKASRGREAETGAGAAALLYRIWPSHLPAPLISSFLQDALSAAQERVPSIARGILFRAVPRNWRVLAEKLGCAAIHADHRRLHPALVAEIREAGYASLAYTVNDAVRANTLFEWGVTSVFSDVPHIIRAAAEASCQPAAADLSPPGAPRQGAVR